jgi:hypothetical protein
MTLLERLKYETDKYSEVVLVRMSDKKKVLRALAIAQAMDEAKPNSQEEIYANGFKYRADKILKGLE